jgi:hypothetical protein
MGDNVLKPLSLNEIVKILVEEAKALPILDGQAPEAQENYSRECSALPCLYLGRAPGPEVRECSALPCLYLGRSLNPPLKGYSGMP